MAEADRTTWNCPPCNCARASPAGRGLHSHFRVTTLTRTNMRLLPLLVMELPGVCCLTPPPLKNPARRQAKSAFCGLLRDEESEHYRVTSVATAASGRGCLGYLAAPAALTVRNCLISKVTSGKSSESSMTVRRTEADRTPGGPPIDRPVSVARVPFLVSNTQQRHLGKTRVWG